MLTLTIHMVRNNSLLGEGKAQLEELKGRHRLVQSLPIQLEYPSTTCPLAEV